MSLKRSNLLQFCFTLELRKHFHQYELFMLCIKYHIICGEKQYSKKMSD